MREADALVFVVAPRGAALGVQRFIHMRRDGSLKTRQDGRHVFRQLGAGHGSAVPHPLDERHGA